MGSVISLFYSPYIKVHKLNWLENNKEAYPELVEKFLKTSKEYKQVVRDIEYFYSVEKNIKEADADPWD